MAKALLAALILAAVYYLFLRKRTKPRRRPVVSMAEREAREILGVGPGADAGEIRAAHRRLIAALHPDRGGSTELTRRINAARDVLLKR